jgi:hypothetical protein
MMKGPIMQLEGDIGIRSRSSEEQRGRLARRSKRNSLDVLRREDHLLKVLFQRVSAAEGSSVEARYEYGNAVKQIIRHLALRQASLMNVARVTSEFPSLRETANRMIDRGTKRRVLIDKVGDLARSIQGLYLNQGQDLDAPLTSLISEVDMEIDWELADAVPLIERTLSSRERDSLFYDARYVERHAPTRLSPSGPRWHERAPVVSRIVTIYDHLRDHPRADRVKRIS